MIPFQPNQMMGIMGGLPQGGVRPFQPSRGPTSFGSRERFGGMMMNNPFQGMGFGMGGQPRPPQVSQQPATPTFNAQPQPFFPMTPTFAPQPAPMTEDERRMLLTTANPFSSGPDAINPMMGNRFNQARMEAGMGGIASLAPRQPIMNTPFGGMGGLADLFRQRMQQFQTTQPPNPSQFMQGARTPSGGPTVPFLGELMPQG